MEVYKEECYDLFAVGDRNKVELRETSKGETLVEGLTAKSVSDIAQVEKLIAFATQNRVTGQTAMNLTSSRSHAICTFTLRINRSTSNVCGEEKPESYESSLGQTTVSKLHLVDLAGSERVKKTGATGDIFAEGVSINRGLLALGNVISALSGKTSNDKENDDQEGSNGPPTKKQSVLHVHVPYRESKV